MVKKRGLLSRMFRLADAEPVRDESNAQRTLVIHKGAIGSPGTESYGGYPREESLRELQGKRRAEIYDEMRNDYQAKMCLSAVRNPLLAATWEIEPADQSDESKRDAELIEQILFKDMLRPTWKKFLSETLSLTDKGHSVFETVHSAVVNQPKFGSYNGIKTLGFRSQKTIERWNLDLETGELKSITQIAMGDLARQVEIPAEFLLVFSLNQEGSNYEGISLLRPCYGPWLRKKVYLKINAIGVERSALGSPLVKVPTNKIDTPEFDLMERALESYGSSERGYLMYPEGWELDLKSNAYDPSKVEASIDAEDKRMTKAFLANFLELGMSSSGSFALSNDLSDFFLGGIEYIAGEICEPINLKLIPDLIKLNRGPRAAYPKLKASGISDKAGKELAEIFKSLGDSKFITPDDVLEEHLRKRYGVPKRDLATARITVAQPAPAAPGSDPAAPGEKVPPMKNNPEDPADDEDPMDDPENMDPMMKKKDPKTGQTLAERIRLADTKRRALLNGNQG